MENLMENSCRTNYKHAKYYTKSAATTLPTTNASFKFVRKLS